ncbi:hypothetical protein A9W95_23185 [Mycobacterium sp. 1423905.2]|nr:hypothetical protein A9W95_23185 [Mycobacterium sp. 1423905.2]
MLAVITAVPAKAAPNPKCALSTAVQEVTSVSQLPLELRGLLPPLADIGAPFNATGSCGTSVAGSVTRGKPSSYAWSSAGSRW